MEVIDPRFKELERKHDALENAVAQIRGELDAVKRTSSDTSRQTIWQFVIFLVTMAVVVLGGIKYQTDTLRREMDLRFDAQRQEMNARHEAQRQEMNARFDAMEKRFEDLKQEVRASRRQ